MPNKNRSEKNSGGLCSTCNNAPDCTLCLDATIPVWECGEYEDTAPLPAKTAYEGVSANGESVFYNPQDSQKTKKYHGLCVNCENRVTCAFEKNDGGVWHCEAYQ